MIPLLSRQIQLAIKLFQGTFLENSLHLQEAQKESGSMYETVTPNLLSSDSPIAGKNVLGAKESFASFLLSYTFRLFSPNKITVLKETR